MRRYRLKKKYRIRLKIFCVFILIIFIFIYCFNKFNNKKEINVEKRITSFYSSISYNNDVKLEKEIKDKIISFLNSYYESLYYLEELDMTKYYMNDNNAYLNQMSLKYYIETRLKKRINLKMDECSYSLYVDSVTYEDDMYNIVIKENSNIKFIGLNGIETKLYNIELNFKYKLVDGEYLLYDFDRLQDYFLMFREDLEDVSFDNFKSTIDLSYQKYTLQQTEEIEKENIFYEQAQIEEYVKKECDYSYDREKAKEYASKWVNKRNLDVWEKYDDWGGNCQNYASQVLYSGGIPMDTVGNQYEQWKHYGATVNESNSKNGRSYSWTVAPYFYQYARDNTGYGLCASVDVNYYYAESGDILQISYNNEIKHTTVVLDKVEKDGKLIDIIVNSNTNDYENFPISAFGVPTKTLIKIDGYNK
jgi:hypothetical protein